MKGTFRSEVLMTLLIGVVAQLCSSDGETHVPAMATREGTAMVRLEWPSLAGKSYQLKSASSVGGPWLTVMTMPTVLVAETNRSAYVVKVESVVQFFRVVKLDTEAPEILETRPARGSIAVGRRSPISVILRDESGIDPSSLQLRVNGGPAITLADSRLAFTNGVLTYTPGTGTPIPDFGSTVAVHLSAADRWGNSLSGAGWSYRTEVQPVLSEKVLFLRPPPGATVPGPLTAGYTLIRGSPQDRFTELVFSYTGDRCTWSEGDILVDPRLDAGFVVEVQGIADRWWEKTVSVLSTPAPLAKCFKMGSFSAAGSEFRELTTGVSQPAAVGTGFEMGYERDFSGVSLLEYQEGSNRLQVWAEEGRFSLNGRLDLEATFHLSQLTGFRAVAASVHDFKLVTRAEGNAVFHRTNEVQVFEKPVRKLYGASVSGIPVWVETVFDAEVGYAINSGIQGAASMSLSAERWLALGKEFKDGVWSTVLQGTPLEMNLPPQDWQLPGRGSARAFLRPRLRVYLQRLIAVDAYLEPWARLDGLVVGDPLTADLQLIGGVQGRVRMEVDGLDEPHAEWTPEFMMNQAVDVIPATPLRQWQLAPPVIEVTSQPEDVTAKPGSLVTFRVETAGDPAARFQWQRDGKALVNGGRVSGADTSTLQLADVSASDVGRYQVVARNSLHSTASRTVEFSIDDTDRPPNPDPERLAWIRPGTFLMGSPPTEVDRVSDEGPQTQVTLTRGFWMGKYEVTQGEYVAVMGRNPSFFKRGLERPVETVSFLDAMDYCARLTARERAAGRLPAGWEYRLPKESQWEYACRAGTTTATAFGDQLSATQANFDGRHPYNGGAVGPFRLETMPVGSFRPNAWGLHDMHGNVWEWCDEWKGALPGGSVTDPNGWQPVWGGFRLVRGGCWYYSGILCRSASRGQYGPGVRYSDIGFRIAVVQVP